MIQLFILFFSCCCNSVSHTHILYKRSTKDEKGEKNCSVFNNFFKNARVYAIHVRVERSVDIKHWSLTTEEQGSKVSL